MLKGNKSDTKLCSTPSAGQSTATKMGSACADKPRDKVQKWQTALNCLGAVEDTLTKRYGEAQIWVVVHSQGHVVSYDVPRSKNENNRNVQDEIELPDASNYSDEVGKRPVSEVTSLKATLLLSRGTTIFAKCMEPVGSTSSLTARDLKVLLPIVKSKLRMTTYKWPSSAVEKFYRLGYDRLPHRPGVPEFKVSSIVDMLALCSLESSEWRKTLSEAAVEMADSRTATAGLSGSIECVGSTRIKKTSSCDVQIEEENAKELRTRQY